MENAGVTVAYVMAEGQEEPVKIISNGMVDISCYVDFDAKKECGINEKVRFSVLAEILEAARTPEELKDAAGAGGRADPQAPLSWMIFSPSIQLYELPACGIGVYRYIDHLATAESALSASCCKTSSVSAFPAWNGSSGKE